MKHTEERSLLRINASELVREEECPTKRFFQYPVKRRQRRYAEPALSLGKAFHGAFEQVMRGLETRGNAEIAEGEVYRDPEWWVAQVRDRLVDDLTARGIEPADAELLKARALALRAAWYFSQPLPFDKVLGAEVELVEETEGVALAGKLDALVQSGQDLWHLQLKTYGGNAIETEVELLKTGTYEWVYSILGRAEAGRRKLNYRGTKLLLFSKDALHSRQAGATCSCCGEKGYVQKPLTNGVREVDVLIPERRDSAHRLYLRTQVRRIELENLTPFAQLRDAPYYPPIVQNPGACGGRFRNSLCQYFDVCQGRISIFDPVVYEDYNPYSHYEGGEL